MKKFGRWLLVTGERLKLESPKYFKKAGRIGWSLTTAGVLINMYPEMSEGFQDAFKFITGLGAGMILISQLTVDRKEDLQENIIEKEMKRRLGQ